MGMILIREVKEPSKESSMWGMVSFDGLYTFQLYVV